jgi:hypothetical protein
VTTRKKKASPLPRSVRIRPWTPLPPEGPKDELAERAKKLPRFGPGLVITVPLSLLPAYLELYHLQPKGVAATGTLLVKRIPPKGRHDDQDHSG